MNGSIPRRLIQRVLQPLEIDGRGRPNPGRSYRSAARCPPGDYLRRLLSGTRESGCTGLRTGGARREQGRRWRPENCAPACELHDNGPSGVFVGRARRTRWESRTHSEAWVSLNSAAPFLIFELQFPESGMSQWKCQIGRNAYGTFSKWSELRSPCRNCGGAVRGIPKEDFALSQQMLHEGCPVRAETEYFTSFPLPASWTSN